MYFIVSWISYEFLCFFTFFFFFPGEICGRHFLKHNNAKTNLFQPFIESKNKHSYMNYSEKTQFALILYTKHHILEPFSVRRACTKSYVTSEPYPRASQIWCQNVRETWKKKVIVVSHARALCVMQSNRAKCRGGGPFRPPPPVYLGLNWLKKDWQCIELCPLASLSKPQLT